MPKDAEIYLTRYEQRYGSDFRKLFKVSNSVVMGKTDFPTTLAREWTDHETKVLSVPPVLGAVANANATVGENTKVVGSTSTHLKLRYADPDKPLLGLDVSDGLRSVNGANEKCVGGSGQFSTAITRTWE